ncbi:iron chelate uptake ABC transporter family permease subunit [Actinosynnema sp. NPDC047251]|uniref:ABC-type iron-siderophore transporter, permease subunit n=1 Tax=Saccharothrix espanaensis (strain ATCC 51144 / DSM 44229 / JCM 9112 / NBRC 15066 / NRRL 15764) TaxID=1179773 RepID=K0JZB0_SACES|nr:iron chelate uptake ABC transporter family permease subunit [Saccharothrix espanaensis]CCH30009.1 ABC-type iron-siderophore transporter, permease subunit [Saccharothrix espanaensis DSM 44229]
MLSRSAGLLLCLVALAGFAVLSIAVGARSVPLSTVFDALWSSEASYDTLVVAQQRVPRTVLGILVGAALGLAGALMQSLTRNPLADPGLLGVNSGAAAAVVTAISFFGLTSPLEYVWFAFFGAAAAALVVYGLGSSGRAGGPVRLALAGTAISAVLVAYTFAVQLADDKALDQFRFWIVGGLAGRDLDVLVRVGPMLALGVVIGLALARPLNVIALGDETGRALGANLGKVRLSAAAAITLLCGAATAAAGPFSFIGLTVPHIARSLVGADQRWVLPFSAVLAPCLLLGADVVGRVVLPPSELEAGLVTAFLGAPVFIALVRGRKVPQL